MAAIAMADIDVQPILRTACKTPCRDIDMVCRLIGLLVRAGHKEAAGTIYDVHTKTIHQCLSYNAIIAASWFDEMIPDAQKNVLGLLAECKRKKRKDMGCHLVNLYRSVMEPCDLVRYFDINVNPN